MSVATEREETGNTAAAKPSLSPTHNLIGVALAAVGAIAFSLRAIFVKLAYEDMSDPVTLLALRMIFSLPFLAAAAALYRRAPATAAPIARRDALALAALGFIGYYLSSFLDMTGCNMSPPASVGCSCSYRRNHFRARPGKADFTARGRGPPHHLCGRGPCRLRPVRQAQLRFLARRDAGDGERRHLLHLSGGQRRSRHQTRIDPLHHLCHRRSQRLLHRAVFLAAAAERARPALARL